LTDKRTVSNIFERFSDKKVVFVQNKLTFFVIFFGLELVLGAEICRFGGIREMSREGFASETETMDFLSGSICSEMFELLNSSR
jgi:hypothetical protein